MTTWPDVIVMEPHSAGLAIGRTMMRAGGRVTAIAEPHHAWEAHSRGVRAIVLPFGSDGDAWLAALEQLAAGCEEAVVLPATDRSCELLIGAAPQLPANLRMFERSGRGHMALMNKDTADGIARRAGVRVPYTAAIYSEDDLAGAVRNARWPCVVKPVMSHDWRTRYGIVRVFMARDAEEAAALVERPLRDGVPMILNQYIPGGDDAVDEAIVVRLPDDSYPVRFGCHKLRQHPRGFGSTTLGESSELPETMQIARRVLDEADFVGIAGVETKRHPDTGERWLLDVNVRVPGQWGLGDACGVEATQRLVMALTGHELPPQPRLRAGVKFVVPDDDLEVCREILHEAPARRRPLLALQLLRPYLGAGDLGLLDPRDPRPALDWLGAVAGRRVARLRTLLARLRGLRR